MADVLETGQVMLDATVNGEAEADAVRRAKVDFVGVSPGSRILTQPLGELAGPSEEGGGQIRAGQTHEGRVDEGLDGPIAEVSVTTCTRFGV